MKKINLVFLQILIIMLGGMFNNTLQTTATSHPYSVDVDDIFGYYVEMAAADNVPGIQFGDNALMLPSNYTAIRIESLPDWGIDPNEGLNITGFTFDGNYSLSYTTPWDADYSQPVNGPPIYWPVLPMGDHTAHFDANTHMSATSTSTEMTVTYTNGTVGNPGYYTATIVYDLSNNLMQSYEVIGNIYFDMDQGYKDVEFRLTLAFKLQPGVSNAHWSTTSVTMVYSVDQAGDPLDNTVDGFNVPTPDYPSGPLTYSYGTFYQDQIMSMDIYNHRDFGGEAGLGYEFSMGVDTGYMGFSIELDLPNRDPTDNALFLYPQLPVGDAGFLEGYFMLAEVANVDYNVDITGSTATLTYDDGLHKLDASWDLDTGFLTHWFGQSLEENDSFVFEFSLLKAFDPFNSNLHWGASAGQGNTYDVLDVLNPDDGGDKIYFDPQDTTNYIQTGDKLYVEPTEFTIFAENHQHPNQQDTNGPHVHYDMEGTQGSATGVVMYFLDNPDDNEGGGGGPPFLNFHFLLGNADFYEFIGYLISSMGGTLTVTQTEIIFSFSMTQGSITASLNSVWDISTGVLVEYQVDLPQMGEDPAMKLHLKLVGEGNLINAAGAQNSSSADDGGLFGLPFIPGDNPIFYLLSTLMVVPILRRRKQLK